MRAQQPPAPPQPGSLFPHAHPPHRRGAPTRGKEARPAPLCPRARGSGRPSLWSADGSGPWALRRPRAGPPKLPRQGRGQGVSASQTWNLMVPQRRGDFPLKTAPRWARRRHGVNPPGACLAPPPRAPRRATRRGAFDSGSCGPTVRGLRNGGGEVKFRPRSGAGEDPGLALPWGRERGPRPLGPWGLPPAERRGLTADAPGLAGRWSQAAYWEGVGETLGPRCLRREWGGSEGRAMPGSWALFLI